MSRIDEALRQAGRKTPAASTEDPDASLNAFPVALADSDAIAVKEHLGPAAIHEAAVMPAQTDLAAERLVTHRNAGNVVIEQYRRLAGVLHQAQVERGVKVVMLASAQAAEGKTLTAVNLALTLSESYKRRVLLIDADLRRPSVAEGVRPAAGERVERVLEIL